MAARSFKDHISNRYYNELSGAVSEYFVRWNFQILSCAIYTQPSFPKLR